MGTRENTIKRVDSQTHLGLAHAVIPFIIYWATPDFLDNIPLKFIVGTAIMGYLCIWPKAIDTRQIGLTLGNGKRSRTVFYGMLLFVFIFTPAIIAALHILNQREIQQQGGYSEAQMAQYVRFEDMGLAGCMPNDDIYENLHQKNIVGVLNASIKPIIAIMITSPIFETILAIGLLFSALVRKWGTLPAFIFIGFFSVVLHLPSGLSTTSIIVFYVGHVTMAALFLYTKSIYPSILLHFWYNALVYTLPILINWGMPPPGTGG